MTAAFAYGLHDSRFYTLQTTDNPLEENGYVEMYRKEANRFNVLKASVKGCSVQGCEIVYDPFEHIVDPYGKSTKRYGWANVTGRLGIPHTAANGKVKMLSGNTVEVLDDARIRELLKGSVFLDGRAAHSLSKRGFAALIGAEVLPGGRPDFIYEGLRNSADYANVSGYLMYNFLLFGSVGTEGGSFYELRPLEASEIITDFLDQNENKVCPGMIRFENSLGGRVAITAFDLNQNSSSAIINYKKKEILRSLIEWIGEEPLPVFVRDSPNIFCIFNASDEKDYAVVVLTNLCSDRFDSVTLDIAPYWLDSSVEILDHDGRWTRAVVEKGSASVKVETALLLMTPVIMRLTRNV